MPNPSNEEQELELQLERTREKKRKLREKKRAEEEAKKKAEEEAVRHAAKEEKQWEEAAARAAGARKSKEEAAEKRRRMAAAAAAAQNCRGPSPGEATSSACRVEVEIPRVIRKGKGRLRPEAVSGDPDNGDDGEDDNDNKDGRAPCERCQAKQIPCQMQAGKRSSLICKPCHDSKVQCSYSGRPPTVKREGGVQPTGERLVVLESQMAQLLADNQLLREGQAKEIPPEMPKTGLMELPRKRKRVVDSDKEEEGIEGEEAKDGEEEEQEQEKEQGGKEEGEEEEEPAPKKARSSNSRVEMDIEHSDLRASSWLSRLEN
ncbi:hypothetical protein EV359DRAFT_83126 [Lentinula novae-zelandiae]|nr:hypothetical protein EV359DRAFT_83126 [Lentinula novae-zelandiae]